MRGHSVVPNDNSTWRPLDTSLEVLSLRNVIVQEIQQKIALLLLVANDATAELRIHEDRLLTGSRVGPYQRVYRRNWFTTNNTSSVSAVVGLLNSYTSVS